MIRRWCEKLSEGRRSLVDEKRSGRQAVAKSDDTAKKIDNTVIIVLCCLGAHFYTGCYVMNI